MRRGLALKIAQLRNKPFVVEQSAAPAREQRQCVGIDRRAVTVARDVLDAVGGEAFTVQEAA
jgi:hypothetical protein